MSTNSFWWSNKSDGPAPQPPAVEPSYDVTDSTRFDGQDTTLTRTPDEDDGERVGETGEITDITYNQDGSVTLSVKNGLEPYQDLHGDFLQVGDTLTQDSVGANYSSSITSATTPYTIGESVVFENEKHLKRTLDEVGNTRAYTISFWIKRTALGATYDTIISNTTTGAVQGLYFCWSLDKLFIGDYSNTFDWGVQTDEIFRDPAEWYHIVFAYDSYNSYQSDRARLYINGKRVPVNNQGYGWPTYGEPSQLGRSGKVEVIGKLGEYTGDYELNAYLADFQFVDGYAHDASAFGEFDSTGKWAAKAVDLTRLSPYDTRSNYEQKWSDALGTLGTWAGSQGPEKAFNGVVGGGTNMTQSDEPIVFTYGAFASLGTVLSGTMRVYIGNSGGYVVDENGNTLADNTGNPGWLELPGDCADYSEIQVRTRVDTPSIAGIEVNGRLLVNGPADESQKWGESTTGNPSSAIYTWDKAFNGVLAEPGASGSGTGTPSYFVKFDGINLIGKELWIATAGSQTLPANCSIEYDNGGGVQVIASNDIIDSTSGDGYTWHRVNTNTFVSMAGIGVNQSIQIYGVKVDGELLVNPGQSWNTDELWSAGGSGSMRSGGGWAQAFNGILTTDGDPTYGLNVAMPIENAGGGSWTGNIDTDGASEVKLYVWNQNALPSQNILINGSSITMAASGGGTIDIQEIDITAEAGSAITSMQINRSVGSDGAIGIAGIKVDGVLIIDGGWGQNGYHLKFEGSSLGFDSSGNNNHWTEEGLSATVEALETSAITNNSGNTLYLTDDTDLAKFKAGDSVKSSETGPDSLAFSTTLYPGQGTPLTINNGIDNTGKSLIWLKNRVDLRKHCLYDTVRGGNQRFSSNLTDAQEAQDSGGTVTFNSNGVTLAAGDGDMNQSGFGPYVAWNFRAAPGFFDIQTYEGPSSGTGGTFPHSLGSTPGMIIIKAIDMSEEWAVYHKEISPGGRLALNSNAVVDGDVWQNTAATATEFTVGGNSRVGGAGQNYIAYLFADTPGKIKCGEFNGGGSINVDCGFQPAWVMWKGTNNDTDWYIFDVERGMVNNGSNQPTLRPNTTDEGNNVFRFWATSNGFASDENLWGSSAEFIYIAIADGVQAPGFGPTGTLAQDGNPTSKTLTLTSSVSDWGTGGTAIREGSEGGDDTIDSPMAFVNTESNLVGNFCTLDPLTVPGGQGVFTSLTNGNLTCEFGPGSVGGSWDARYAYSTSVITEGKWYCEMTVHDIGDGISSWYVGVMGDTNGEVSGSLGFFPTGIGYLNFGGIISDSDTLATKAPFTTVGDVVGIAIDADNSTVEFYNNGVSQGVYAMPRSTVRRIALNGVEASTATMNFGQRPLAYPKPDGYRLLCSAND